MFKTSQNPNLCGHMIRDAAHNLDESVILKERSVKSLEMSNKGLIILNLFLKNLLYWDEHETNTIHEHKCK